MKKLKRPRWLPWVLVIAGVLIVIAIGAANRHSGGIDVSTATVKRSTLVVKLPENGTVDLPQTATIAAKTAGEIVTIVAHAGERVQTGDLLMQLDDRQAAATVAGDEAQVAQGRATLANANAKLQADINSRREGQVSGLLSGSSLGMSGQAALVQAQQTLSVAQSNLQTAQETYQGDLALYKINGLPRQQLDRDRAAYDQAQTNYTAAKRQYDLTAQELRDTSGQLDTQIAADKNAVSGAQASLSSAVAMLALHQSQLADTQVRAPLDGVIQTVGTSPSTTGGLPAQLSVGDAVTAGQTLFTIAGPGAMVIRAQVDEQDISAVQVGQRVEITGQDFPGKTLGGSVSRIAPVVVSQTTGANAAKNVETTIALDKPYPFLRAGMSCDVDIITGLAPNAISVPLGAVFDDGNKHYVYIVRQGVAHKTEVSKGLASDTDVAITRGVSPGDVVATSNLTLLHDGARVKTTTATPSPSPT